MLPNLNYLQNEPKILQNLNNFSNLKCNAHTKFKAEQFCIHATCIQNSTSLLCELCASTHNSNHKALGFIPIHTLFSTQLLEKVMESKKAEHQIKFKYQEVLNQVDEMIIQLAKSLSDLIESSFFKVNYDVKVRLRDLINLKDTDKIVYDYQETLLKFLCTEELPELNSFLVVYLKKYEELRLLRIRQIEEPHKEYDQVINQLDDIKKKLQIKYYELHDELQDMLKYKIEEFEIISYKTWYDNSSLISKLKNSNINEMETIPIMPINEIAKLIYDEKRNLILSSSSKGDIMSYAIKDGSFSFLGCEEQKIQDIMLLKNGKLAIIANNKVKIWNIDTAQCEEIFSGQSNFEINYLHELDDSFIVCAYSGKGLLDILDLKAELLRPFYSFDTNLLLNVSNIVSIKEAEMAIADRKSVHIINFDHKTKTNFKIMKRLVTSDNVIQMQLMHNSTDLLMIRSFKKFELWKISQSKCLRTFADQGRAFRSMLIISDRIFALGGDTGLKFWDMDNNKPLKEFKMSESIRHITPLSANSFIFCKFVFNNPTQTEIILFKY